MASQINVLAWCGQFPRKIPSRTEDSKPATARKVRSELRVNLVKNKLLKGNFGRTHVVSGPACLSVRRLTTRTAKCWVYETQRKSVLLANFHLIIQLM